jgi:hypothetical protein
VKKGFTAPTSSNQDPKQGRMTVKKVLAALVLPAAMTAVVMAPTVAAAHGHSSPQATGQVEGVVSTQTAVAGSTTMPPALSGQGLLAALGASGITQSNVSLSLVGRQSTVPVASPAWVLLQGKVYTGALEPGQRIHAILINGDAVLMSIQGPYTWAEFEGYTAGSGSTASSINLTEPYMAQGTTYSVSLAAGATAKSGNTAVDWSQIAAGTRVRVAYNNAGAITAVRVLGKASMGGSKGSHGGTHGKGQQGRAVRGTLDAVSATSITVNGTTYNLGSSVTVTGSHKAQLSLTSLLQGQTVLLHLKGGAVTRIQVFWMHPVHGTVSAVGGNSITLGSTSYTLASTVKVSGAGHYTSTSQIPSGARVVLGFNAQDQVAWIRVAGH